MELERVRAKVIEIARRCSPDPTYAAWSRVWFEVTSEFGDPVENAFAEMGPIEASILSLRDGEREISRFVHLRDPTGPRFLLLWGAHALIADLLPACYYLGLEGPPSAGKTRTMNLMLHLVGGKFVSDTTEATLGRILTPGVILGFDELDDQLKGHRDGMVESLIRQGTHPDAVRRVLQPGGRQGEWKELVLPLYGAKIFTVASDPAAALLSRTYLLHLDPQDDVDLLVNNLYATRLSSHLSRWLKAKAEEVRKVWTKERVQALIMSPGFRGRLEKVKVSLPRDREIAALMMATAELYGWTESIESLVPEKINEQAGNRGDEIEALLRNHLVAVYSNLPRGGADPPTEWISVLLGRLNELLKQIGLRGLSPEHFGKGLRQIGARDKIEIRKVSSAQGKRQLVFTGEFVAKLLQQASAPAAGGTGLTGPTGIYRQGEGIPGGPAIPASEVNEDDLFGGRPARADRARQRLAEGAA